MRLRVGNVLHCTQCFLLVVTFIVYGVAAKDNVDDVVLPSPLLINASSTISSSLSVSLSSSLSFSTSPSISISSSLSSSASNSPSVSSSKSISSSTSTSTSPSTISSPTPTNSITPSASPPVYLNSTFGNLSPVTYSNNSLKVSSLCGGTIDQESWVATESICSYKTMVNITRCDLKERPKHISMSLTANSSSSDSVQSMYKTVGYTSMIWMEEFVFNVTLSFSPWIVCNPFDFPQNEVYNWTLQWTVYPEQTGDVSSPYWTQWNPGTSARALPASSSPFSLSNCTVVLPVSVPNFLHPFTEISPGVGFHVDCTLVGAGSTLGVGVHALRHVGTNETRLPQTYDMFISLSPWSCASQSVQEILGIVSTWNVTCVFLLSDYTRSVPDPPSVVQVARYDLNGNVLKDADTNGLIWSSNATCLGSILLPQPFSRECYAQFALTVPDNCLNPPHSGAVSVHVSFSIVIFNDGRTVQPATSSLLTGVGTFTITSSNSTSTMDTLNFYYQLAPWIDCEAYTSPLNGFNDSSPVQWTMSFSTVFLYEDDDDGESLGFPVYFWYYVLSILLGFFIALFLFAVGSVMKRITDRLEKRSEQNENKDEIGAIQNCVRFFWTQLSRGNSLKPIMNFSDVRKAENVYLDISDEEQPSLAVCLSGGGIRSACFSLGVLEGLKEELLKEIKLLSCVSGGGYAGTAYMQRLKMNQENSQQSHENIVKMLQEKVKANPGYLYRKKLSLIPPLLCSILFLAVVLLMFAFPISSVMKEWCYCNSDRAVCYGATQGRVDDDDGNYAYDDSDSVYYSFGDIFLTMYICPNYAASNPKWLTLYSLTISSILILLPIVFVFYTFYQCVKKVWKSEACRFICGKKCSTYQMNMKWWKDTWDFFRNGILALLFAIFVWESICAMTFLYTILFRDAYVSMIWTVLLTGVSVLTQAARIFTSDYHPLIMAIVGVLMIIIFTLVSISVISVVTYLSLTYFSSSAFFWISVVNIILSCVLIIIPELFREAINDFVRRSIRSVFFQKGEDFKFDRNNFPERRFPLYLSNCTLEDVVSSDISTPKDELKAEEMEKLKGKPITFTFSQLHYGSLISGYYRPEEVCQSGTMSKRKREVSHEKQHLVQEKEEEEEEEEGEENEQQRYVREMERKHATCMSQSLSVSMALSGAALATKLGDRDSGNISYLVRMVGVDLGNWIPRVNIVAHYGFCFLWRLAFMSVFLWLTLSFLLSSEPIVHCISITLLFVFFTFTFLGFEHTSYIPLLRFIRHSLPYSNLDAATTPYLFLTDGGHSENLGLKEAIKRFPKLIVSVDGGQDRARELTELDNSLQKARKELKDEGFDRVEYTFKTSPLELSTKTELGIEISEKNYVWIQYKCAKLNSDGSVDSSSERKGDIIYLKATLVKKDLRVTDHRHRFSYRKYSSIPTNNEDRSSRTHLYSMGHPEFPHDPTINQNLSTRTEEAYMKLGRDNVSIAFREIKEEDGCPDILKEKYPITPNQEEMNDLTDDLAQTGYNSY